LPQSRSNRGEQRVRLGCPGRFSETRCVDVELSEEAHPADCDATHYSERITQTSAALAIPTASFRAESASR
jgi:hypothetical protein